jgi:hypothetical protein
MEKNEGLEKEIKEEMPRKNEEYSKILHSTPHTLQRMQMEWLWLMLELFQTISRLGQSRQLLLPNRLK